MSHRSPSLLLALIVVSAISNPSARAEAPSAGGPSTADVLKRRRVVADRKFAAGVVLTVLGAASTLVFTAALAGSMADGGSDRGLSVLTFGALQLTLSPLLFSVGIPLTAKGLEEGRQLDRLAATMGVAF